MFKEYDVYKLAAQKLIDENCLIFDTETTGLNNDDEIVELGIIDCKGNILYEGMFCPEKQIDPGASQVSGITNEMLEKEPRFKDEFEKIMGIMDGRPVMAFNEMFDERLFFQTAERYQLDMSRVEKAFSRAFCCMNIYSCYLGFSGRTKLEFACDCEDVNMVQNHRATGDCQMTLALLEKIADPERVPDLSKYLQIKAERTGKPIEQAPVQRLQANSSAYLSLFNDNKSLSEIAGILGVRLSTVEEHIVDLYKKGDIQSVGFMIDDKYVTDILKIAHAPAWNGWLRTIKSELPEECSYGCIRAVLAKDQREGFASTKPSLDNLINKAEEKSAVAAESAEPVKEAEPVL